MRKSSVFPSAHTPRCQHFLVALKSKNMLVEFPVHIPKFPKAATKPMWAMKFFMAGLQLIILWRHIKCSFNFFNLIQTHHLVHFLAGQIDLPNHQNHQAVGEPLEHPCFIHKMMSSDSSHVAILHNVASLGDCRSARVKITKSLLEGKLPTNIGFHPRWPHGPSPKKKRRNSTMEQLGWRHQWCKSGHWTLP